MMKRLLCILLSLCMLAAASLALAEEFRLPSQNPAFRDHFCDILEYRAAEYYRKRYDKENKMPEQD